jgi:cytochrome c
MRDVGPCAGRSAPRFIVKRHNRCRLTGIRTLNFRQLLCGAKQQKIVGGLTMVRSFIVLLFTAFAMTGFARADEVGTKVEAVAMVKRVQEMFKQDGAEATFKAVSDPSTKEFHDRDLYPFVYFRDGDKKGLCVAHGARPALIGKNLIGLKDQDGKYLIQALADVANGPGSGWVDYKWPNPVNNKIEDKSSYVEKMGDYFVGVGVYR